MVIHGLQKLTLLDYPGHTACTVFTAHCPWRCPFCHNASLVLEPESQPVIPEEEIFSFLAHRKGLLDGVAVTGGEPTLQRDLPEFLRKIKALGCAVKLDTNGTNPARLRAILSEKLADYVGLFHPALAGLTGTPEQTAQVAKEYRAFYQKVGEGEGYTMNHSLTVYLMGPDGQFRSAVAHDLGPDRTAKLIENAMERG